MRWDDEVTLLDVASGMTVDDEGNEVEGEPVATTLMCNRWYTAIDTWATAGALGPKPAAQFQIRSIDYDGQTQAIWHGEEMDVSYVSQQGEFVLITLAKHVRNDEVGNG